uniref:Site-specific integrase n=1 Tax=Strongyloides papillosus TaxID=174720 RepID=A0A0N5BX23_STREA
MMREKKIEEDSGKYTFQFKKKAKTKQEKIIKYFEDDRHAFLLSWRNAREQYSNARSIREVSAKQIVHFLYVM